MFRDLSGTMSDPFLLRSVATHIALAFEGKFSAVLAVDARGFILGTMVSQISSCRLVLARKLGKLPGAVHRATYEFEYGATALEVQRDALSAEQSVLVVDDVLATGGTLAAAGALVSRAGAKLSGFATALELTELGGRRTLAPYPVFSLLTT
ncbi:adenine phosphoribosyltransferase [Actinopolyspora mzabensis]|uniref:adenine phosphoribosyltransferase n=1 Tax=Actinopolyspora mzabensis TaxID=995066 RepID=A0A1G9FQW1_ACTMZ|nr:adenine phosphoribosyltransferase [Actinopolyspora mzabensis]